MKKLALLASLAFVLSACTPQYTSLDLPRPFRGGENATVVVQEYGDFQCPACGQAYSFVKALKDQFGDMVRWEYYHFPLTQIHPYAFNAAMAAECAHDQGKFWEMHDIMFENQENLKRSDIDSYASQIGLDTELFSACLKSRAKSDIVQSDQSQGQSAGVNSTPTFFVNGQKVDNWSQLESIINSYLQPSVPTQADENAAADAEDTSGE